MPFVQSTITRPSDVLGPQEMLAAQGAGLDQAVNTYGPAKIAEINRQLANQQALLRQEQAGRMGLMRAEQPFKRALIEQQLAGEKEIAQWHVKNQEMKDAAQQKLFDDKIAAQVKAAKLESDAQVDRMDRRALMEKAMELQPSRFDRVSGLLIPGITPLPDENDGTTEGLRRYVSRASSEQAQTYARLHTTIEKNTAMVNARKTELLNRQEHENELGAQSAGVVGVQNFIAGLSGGGLFSANQQKAFTDTLQANLKKGLPYEAALSATERSNPAFLGATDAFREAATNRSLSLRAQPNRILEQQLASLDSLLKNQGALAHEKFELPKDLPGGGSGASASGPPGFVNLTGLSQPATGAAPAAGGFASPGSVLQAPEAPRKPQPMLDMQSTNPQEIGREFVNQATKSGRGERQSLALSRVVADRLGLTKNSPAMQIGSSSLSHDPGMVINDILARKPSNLLPGLNRDAITSWFNKLPIDDQKALYQQALDGAEGALGEPKGSHWGPLPSLK
jgi:hypothetical protein